jgi:hypothetical protein
MTLRWAITGINLYGAETCAPCHVVQPKVEACAILHGLDYTYYDVMGDGALEAQKAQVMNIPAMEAVDGHGNVLAVGGPAIERLIEDINSQFTWRSIW